MSRRHSSQFNALRFRFHFTLASSSSLASDSSVADRFLPLVDVGTASEGAGAGAAGEREDAPEPEAMSWLDCWSMSMSYL